jgi:hypothetical protein
MWTSKGTIADSGNSYTGSLYQYFCDSEENLCRKGGEKTINLDRKPSPSHSLWGATDFYLENISEA